MLDKLNENSWKFLQTPNENEDFTLAKVFFRFSVEATDTGSFDTRHTRTIQMIYICSMQSE